MSAALKILDELLPEKPVVASQNGTTPKSHFPEKYLNEKRGQQMVLDEDVDNLFGQTECYRKYIREKPEHRLMLWLKLNGHNNREISNISGYGYQSVCNVCKQPWFVEAFCRISTEMGKDAVETFLEGEIVPTLSRLGELRYSESDAVSKAACDSILDRIRGKPTVRVESKVSGQIDNVVYDVAKLQDEYQRNQQILQSRGIQPSGTN